MSNAVKTPEVVAKANPVADQVTAEVLAQSNATSAFIKASGAIGPLGLEKLAIALGESANKSGRPAFGAWLAYVMAIASSKPGYAVQNRLAALANRSVPAGEDGTRKEVAKSKAKGSVGQASCSYRINAPVAWEIAIGE